MHFFIDEIVSREKFSSGTHLGEKNDGLYSDDEVNKLSRGNLRLQETPDLVSSLNEAWFHTLDRCVVDTP